MAAAVDSLDALLGDDLVEKLTKKDTSKKKRRKVVDKKSSKRKRKRLKQKEKEDDEKVLQSMTDEQKKRFETLKKKKLDKDFIENVIKSLLDSNGKERLGKNKAERQIIGLVVRDVAQMFIGDIVEESDFR
eukprot:1139106-Amorphochlora_amoeboformis.AAC.2